MTSNVYDYLTAAFIVGSLFIAAVIVIPNIGYVNLLSVDQQQLRNVGLEVLKSMLFEEGSPEDWGTLSEFDQSEVKKFGLASSSTSLYVLDSDKVDRIVQDNPLGFLEYNRIRELLKLDGYGFNLRIRPPFNATIKDLTQQTELHFEITVEDYTRRPIPNAVVKALIIYSYRVGGSDESYAIDVIEIQEITNEIGKCTIKKRLTGQISDFLTSFITTVGDVATVIAVYRGGTPPQQIADVNIIGDQATLTFKESEQPRDARWVCDIAMLNPEGATIIYKGNKQSDTLNYGSLRVWNKTFQGLSCSNPVLLVFNICAVEKPGGRKGILVVGPYPTYTGNRVIQYGENPKGSVTVINLQRTVCIRNLAYIFEIELWKRI